jgi:ribose transport system substrate-binding protein
MKSIWKIVLSVCMLTVLSAGVLFAGGGAASGSQRSTGMKVGMTIHDLSNPVFAATSEALKKLVESKGGQLTYMDCKTNITTQISQIENFISSGVDILLVEPVASTGFEASFRLAKEKGIKIFVWDSDVDIADVSWIIDNYSLGQMIGEETAKWVNEKFNGVCEIAVLDYPQLEIIIERAKGITDTLAKLVPNAKIVAQTSAVTPTEGMSKTETILQSNPNLKVIASIGGGGAVGANEAFKAAGKLTPDVGIFAADATPAELTAIANNEAIRCSIMISGTPEDQANEIYAALEKLYTGQPVEKRLFRRIFPVNKDNYARYR